MVAPGAAAQSAVGGSGVFWLGMFGTHGQLLLCLAAPYPGTTVDVVGAGLSLQDVKPPVFLDTNESGSAGAS